MLVTRRGLTRRAMMRASFALFWLLVFVAWLLSLATPAAALDTPPIQLCDVGLNVGLRLLRADDLNPWAEVPLGDANLQEIGDGTYIVTGLPDAAGRERYQLQLTRANAPEVVLATYAYGARPGQRIVWRHLIDLPATPRTFKQGDTFGAIELKIRSGLPSDVGNPQTTATFQLVDPTRDAVLFSGRSAVIANVVQNDGTSDADAPSWGASLVYDLQPGDLDVAGRLLGAFRICYLPTACHTLPVTPSLELIVLPSPEAP